MILKKSKCKFIDRGGTVKKLLKKAQNHVVTIRQL